MEKTVFNADDIHVLRIDLAGRRSKMTSEEAQRDFEERVNRGRRAIEAIRAAKTSSAKPCQ